jgi:hypothetical protein
MTQHTAACLTQLPNLMGDGHRPCTCGAADAAISAEIIRRGYRVERSLEDGHYVERVIRPDGTVAIIAKRPL